MSAASTFAKFARTVFFIAVPPSANAEIAGRTVLGDGVVAYRSGQREQALKWLEQPHTPAERSQGFAWLLIASQGYLGSYGSSARKEREDVMRKQVTPYRLNSSGSIPCRDSSL